ncbi:MAG: hypothetical protein QW837_08615 [Conexivisphaerales archaeon]
MRDQIFLNPLAMDTRVLMLHGAITIPSNFADPLAIGALISISLYILNEVLSILSRASSPP